jgi:hypothetical protein
MFFYTWYLTLGNAYIPAFQAPVNQHAFGVLISIAGWTIWLGRAHWAKVGRAMFLWWCVLAAFTCAIIALIMARIIAETGIPALWTGRITVQGITALFPMQWLSAPTLLMIGALYALVTRASAVSASVLSTLAIGADKKASPRHQGRLAIGGLVLLLVGFLICGAVHIKMGYSSAEVSTNPKTSGVTIDKWAQVENADYKFFTKERGDEAVGLGMGLGLLWACSRFPAWPIHPVGLLFCRFSLGHLIWFSVFLGWLVKAGITSLFGGGAYRKARPFFLGLIMGELFAIIVWALVPVIIVLVTGVDAADVPRYMLMRYP